MSKKPYSVLTATALLVLIGLAIWQVYYLWGDSASISMLSSP
jgi:hypothetical protein